MVSPRRTVDIENPRGVDFNNPIGLKNQLFPLKAPSVPLGDVRNTLGTARNVLKNLADASKNDLELKPSKSMPIPANPDQNKEAEQIDPIWDAPLAYGREVEDTYCDIIPLSLQLTDDDMSCLALNKSGPRTGISLSSWTYEDETYIPEIDFDFICKQDMEEMRTIIQGYSMYDDDDLPPVPLVEDFEDSCMAY